MKKRFDSGVKKLQKRKQKYKMILGRLEKEEASVKKRIEKIKEEINTRKYTDQEYLREISILNIQLSQFAKEFPEQNLFPEAGSEEEAIERERTELKNKISEVTLSHFGDLIKAYQEEFRKLLLVQERVRNIRQEIEDCESGLQELCWNMRKVYVPA